MAGARASCAALHAGPAALAAEDARGSCCRAPGRKAHQLNWALRPETLARAGGGRGTRRRVRGRERRGLAPRRERLSLDRREDLGGRGGAYQGVTLSLANFERLGPRGRVCAIQQSSIFIRVSIARLINEVRRVAWFGRLGPAARAGRPGRAPRSSWASGARRSASVTTRSCVSTCWLGSAAFRPPGATEDSTLGYALGARGVLIGADADGGAGRHARDRPTR